jgi:hypothetical protein
MAAPAAIGAVRGVRKRTVEASEWFRLAATGPAPSAQRQRDERELGARAGSQATTGPVRLSLLTPRPIWLTRPTGSTKAMTWPCAANRRPGSANGSGRWTTPSV